MKPGNLNTVTVQTETAHLCTTGGKVWEAAYRMFDFLKCHLPREGHLKILELGSGCGWLGMSLAEYLGDTATIVMTEQENGGGLAWLKHNLSLNPHLSNCQALGLDWINVPCEFQDTHWDVIIGSELVYSPITCELLPKVLATLARPTTLIYYAHNCNRFEMLDLCLLENFAGLKMQVIPNLRDSLPTTLSADLFPDLELEIYTIKL